MCRYCIAKLIRLNELRRPEELDQVSMPKIANTLLHNASARNLIIKWLPLIHKSRFRLLNTSFKEQSESSVQIAMKKFCPESLFAMGFSNKQVLEMLNQSINLNSITLSHPDWCLDNWSALEPRLVQVDKIRINFLLMDNFLDFLHRLSATHPEKKWELLEFFNCPASGIHKMTSLTRIYPHNFDMYLNDIAQEERIGYEWLLQNVDGCFELLKHIAGTALRVNFPAHLCLLAVFPNLRHLNLEIASSAFPFDRNPHLILNI